MSSAVPSIRSPNFADPELNRILNEIKLNVDNIYGRVGVNGAAFVSSSSYALDIAGIRSDISVVTPIADTPHQPLNLAAVGAFNSVILSWSSPTYTGHAYTIIYRSGTNDIGTAVQISTTAGTIFTDSAGSGNSFYYWIKFVSVKDESGPVSAVAYTQTAYSFNQVMSTLIVPWEATKNYASGDYIAPDYTPAIGSSRFWFEVTTDSGSSNASAPAWASITAAGQTIADGGLIWTARSPQSVTTPFIIGSVGGVKTVVISNTNIHDAAITSAKIALLAVDNGHIANLNVSKLLGGTITGQQVYIGDTSFLLDGSTKRLTISDGVYSRVELGNLGGGAFGLVLRDGAGQIFLNSGGVQYLNGVASATVTSNAANGSTAFTETVKYRTTGAPTTTPSPSGITITSNTNGTVNIRLDWEAYTQGSNQSDFLMLFWRKDSTAPTVNDSAISFNVNTSSASYYIFEGVNPADTWSFGLAAARRTESGLEIGAIQAPASTPDWLGVTSGTPNYTANINGTAAATVATNAANGASAWSKFSGAGSTLPSGNVEFNFAGSSSKGGSATNTDSVGAQSASTVASATVNFNNRNDRNATAVVTPAVANAVGTIDHTLNSDGSADISFEWTWGGDEAEIDGFILYIHDNGTTTPTGQHVFTGSADATETVYYVTAQRRAFITYGVSANHWYTFGIQAYRIVDPDVNASGVLKSSIVQPVSGATETTFGAYRPSSNVAFAGDVTGTINGGAISSYLNTNISINSSGTLTGAGSGQVTLGGLGAGAFATLSQITSGNVATYLDTNAISATYISSLACEDILAGTINVALTINSPTINTGTLNSGTIYTGHLSTAASGSTGLRTEIKSSDNKIHFYNASNQEVVTIGTTTSGAETYELWIRNSGNYGCLVQASNIAIWGESTSGGGNAIRGRIYTGNSGVAIRGYTESTGTSNTGIIGEAFNAGNFAGAFSGYYSGAQAWLCSDSYGVEILYSGGTSSVRKGALKLPLSAAPSSTEKGALYVDSTTESLQIGKSTSTFGHIPDSRSSFSGSSFTVANNSSYTPSTPGFYYIVHNIDGDTSIPSGIIEQIYVSSAWRNGHLNSACGFKWFDGSNMRIYNSSTAATRTVYYQRMT